MGISRSGFYYEPVPESPENLALMRRLDELHLEHPVYGPEFQVRIIHYNFLKLPRS
jgi:putative transposase